ncbi:hypothetical protein GCM10010279_37370 [Streptomyces mutabilis]|nr:hypothetical protein GCM10010279_37370 [Streptomyces mutabilis]
MGMLGAESRPARLHAVHAVHLGFHGPSAAPRGELRTGGQLPPQRGRLVAKAGRCFTVRGSRGAGFLGAPGGRGRVGGLPGAAAASRRPCTRREGAVPDVSRAGRAYPAGRGRVRAPGGFPAEVRDGRGE